MSQVTKTTLTKVSEAGDGALFMPVPPELLQKLAIREGDRLLLTEQPDGTLLLRPAAPSSLRGAKRRGNP